MVNMCYQPRICLIVLVGIPCSGKSYFRKYFETHISDNCHSLGSVVMCSVCYDDFDKVRNPQCFLDDTRWKDERCKVFESIKGVLSFFQQGSDNEFSSCFPNILITNHGLGHPDCVFIVVDDNMYYRSMRHDYYKLSRTHNIGFVQIYFDVKLEDALKCNNLRSTEARVPNHILISMFNKIEPPKTNHVWELNTLNVSSFADFKKDNLISKVETLIKNALSSCMPSNKEEFSIGKEESRAITNASALHKVDNALKKIVGVIIKNKIKENMVKSREISQKLSQKRLSILKQIKEGVIILPIDITKPVEEENIVLVNPILLNLLKN